MRRFLVLILLLVSVGPALGGELIAFYGATNETGRQYDSFAYQVEYREGLGENAAVSVSYLNEGHVPNHHRDGLAPLTLWGRVNLLNRRLSLAVGAGPYLYADTTQTPLGLPSDEHGVGGFGAYFAIDKRGGPHPGDGGSAFVSGVMSATASLRNFSFDPDLTVRFVMNRIVTNYSKDTDVFLIGLGYRF
jgi:hypothetical protein